MFRSKAVFNVTAHLSFHPQVISTVDINCLNGKDETLPMITVTACFEVVEATKTKASGFGSL